MMESGKQTIAIVGHVYGTHSIAISSDQTMLAARGPDEQIHLWDVKSGKEIRRFSRRGKRNSFDLVAFSVDGKHVAAESGRRKLVVWNREDGKQVLEVDLGGDRSFSRLAFSPDGSMLAVLDRSEEISLIEVPSGKPIAFSASHQATVNCMAWSRSGEWLASGSKDGAITFWTRALRRG